MTGLASARFDSRTASRDMLKTILDSCADAIVITDIEARIIYVNPAFEDHTGYSREDAIGKNPRILKSGKQSPVFYKDLWDTLRSGNTWRGIFVNRRKDKTTFYEESTISPVKDPKDRVTHYVAIKRDITGNMEVQERMAQSEKLSAVGQLASGIAHQILTPLTVMLGMSQMLEEMDGLPGRAKEYSRIIARNARRAGKITQGMLSCSRKRGRARKAHDLRDILRETLQLVRHEIIRNHLKVKVAYTATAPISKVNADQIQEALINLIINALHAMENSEKRELTLRVEAGPHGNKISVADTGCGIPYGNLARIFEPFFTTKPVGKGTGLGLSLCYQIAVENGGILKASTPPEGGTVFTLELPRLICGSKGRCRPGSYR